MTQPFPSAARLLSAVALSLVASCTSPDPESTKPTTPTGNEKRDTSITHETCDGNSPTAVKVDINGDGKNDIVHVMKGDKEVCRIVDLNLDGFPDSFIYYEADGKTERRRESDFDRDGLSRRPACPRRPARSSSSTGGSRDRSRCSSSAVTATR